MTNSEHLRRIIFAHTPETIIIALVYLVASTQSVYADKDGNPLSVTGSLDLVLERLDELLKTHEVGLEKDAQAIRNKIEC